MARNPFKDNSQKDQRTSGVFSLGVGEVTNVPDNNAHQIGVRPLTKTGDGQNITKPTGMTVAVSQKGDIAVPNKGDLVVFGRIKNRKNIVLGVLYSQESNIRDYDSQERHIGSESNSGTFIHGPFGVVPKIDEAPSAPPDGSVWYRSDLGEYRGMEDGTKVRFNTTAI
jgi:hypothetical protein